MQKAKMLTVSKLTISLRKRPILRGVSFSLLQGEALAITGPSGCGKTTLLRAICGFVDSFDDGQITHNNVLWQDRKNSVLKVRQRPVTLLHQELAVWPHLTVRQQLDLVAPKNHTLLSSDLLISKLMLEHRADTLGRDLSGGEKQRLALGRVLKSAPRILLLDEPFSALDKVTKLHIIDFVHQFRAALNCSIIFATHDATDPATFSAKTLDLSDVPE